jgi:hypothetical protein
MLLKRKSGRNKPMSAKASEIVKLAQSWLGIKEGSAEHQALVDLYNSFLPHPRNHTMKVTEPWCAMTMACLAIKLGCTDIIPVECGCGEMIELCKKFGIWVENDAYVPAPGDLLFYDWQDSGKGDNKGWPDHVGIVEKVAGNIITVIEGNYKNAVSYRTIGVNARNIRGYAQPKYDPEEVSFIHEGLDYSVLFDPTYYSNKYADLKNAFGDDSARLFEHFLKHGMKEARQPSESFDVAYYKSEYKDLQKAFGDNLPEYYKHYIRYGKKEGRKTIQKYGVRVGSFIDRKEAEALVEELAKLGYKNAKVYNE